MLRIAIQAKGRLNEQSIGLLSEAGIGVAESKRKLISRADGFPMEVLYLRDDDIPQAVAMGVADLGIVGLNEVAEKNFPVERTMDLGFGSCRISLAVDRTADYNGLDYFRGSSPRRASTPKSTPSKGRSKSPPPWECPTRYSTSYRRAAR